MLARPGPARPACLTDGCLPTCLPARLPRGCAGGGAGHDGLALLLFVIILYISIQCNIIQCKTVVVGAQRGQDARTTVMIRNIPNKYTQVHTTARAPARAGRRGPRRPRPAGRRRARTPRARVRLMFVS
jgi:hypothetical protein